MDTSYRVLRGNIRNNLYNGIAWSVGYNFTVPFFAIIASRFGATNTHYALLNSVPALMTILATLPASMIIERFRHQKRAVAVLLLISRLNYLLLALLPFLPFSQIHSLIFLVGVYSATSAVIGVSWQAMMGEIIPIKYRNKVFAQRNIWTSITGMAVTLVAGYYIDSFAFPYGYQTAYLFGLAGGLLETWYFYRLRIPSEEANENIREKVNEIVRHVSITERFREFAGNFKFKADRTFYLFCACAVIFQFAWMAPWPVFTLVKIDILHATNTMISINTVTSTLGQLIAFGFWARFADRKGNGYTVFIGSLLMATNPIMWMFSYSMNWVYAIDFVGGFVTVAFTQSIFNRLLELAPVESRQKSIAFYTSLTQIAAIFAPIVGMRVYEMVPYNTLMLLVSGVRVFGALCFLAILYPHALRRFKKQDRSQSA